MDYGTFEDTIPKGEYGGGTVQLWARGIWIPFETPLIGFKKGNLKFELEGRRLKGGWALVRIKGLDDENSKNWLLIKHADNFSINTKELDITEKEQTSIKTGRSLSQIKDSKLTLKSNKNRETLTKKSLAEGNQQNIDTIKKISKIPLAQKVIFPKSIHPQLAVLVKTVPTGKGSIIEPECQ